MKGAVTALLFVGASAQSGNYFVGPSHTNYIGATKVCADAGGKLATFHNDANYGTASALCKSKCESSDAANSGCGCWIGLKDDIVEGTWRWTDASAKDYAMSGSGVATQGVYPWWSGEPNNAGSGEDCAHIWKPQSYYLNDIPCSATGYYPMCEEFTDDEKPNYYTVNTKTTFSTGSSLCQSELDELASFHSDAEYALAQSVCIETCTTVATTTSGCGCWVGLQDATTEGTWAYTDGSASDYAMDGSGNPTTGVYPWWTGEPNDAGSGEDCAHIWEPQSYYLNDIPCESTTYTYFPLCLDTGITLSPTPAPTCETEKPDEPQLSITLASQGTTEFADGLYARVLTTEVTTTKNKKRKGKTTTTTYEWSDWTPLTGECGKLSADLTDYFDDFSEIEDGWSAVALYNCGSETFNIDAVSIWNGKKAKTIDYFCSGISGPSKGCGTMEASDVGTCDAGFDDQPFNAITIDSDMCGAVSFVTDEQTTDSVNVAKPFDLADPGIPGCVVMGYAAKKSHKMVKYQAHNMQQQQLVADNGEIEMDMMAYASDNAVTIGAPLALMVVGAAAFVCYRRNANKGEEYKSLV